MQLTESPKMFCALTSTLAFACLISTGCDDMAGKAMETALEHGGDEADPNSVFAKLKAEKANCPQPVNEHTTLTDVSLRGLDRIRYTYVVSESGRPEVNMLNQGKIQAEVLERARFSHLAPIILEKGFGVDHFFEDADGKCLLWMEMTSREYEGVEFADPNTAAAPSVTLVRRTTQADRDEMLVHLEEEQANCPRQINDYTTLKSIKLKGTNRVKYLYVVTEDGLPHVNMDVEEEVKQQVLDRTKSTPLGDSIVRLDMGVEHFFQDTDGRCMLWLQMTKNDFVGGPKLETQATEAEETTEIEQPEPEPQAEVEVAAPTKIESYIPEKAFPGFDNPLAPGVQTNPYVK